MLKLTGRSQAMGKVLLGKNILIKSSQAFIIISPLMFI